jgi:hypothetical protein
MKGLVLRYLHFALLILMSVTVLAQRPSVHRIDPPHWWVGFSNPEVELLVHGASLTEKVELEAKGISIKSISSTPNPGYLRITLEVKPSAQAQEIVLSFYNGNKKRKITYPFQARSIQKTSS